jgi:hypothetical protein
MERFGSEERWERIVIFSRDGLPMAAWGHSESYSDETLLEVGFSLMETANLLSPDGPVQDFVVQGKSGKLLVYQYLSVWDEPILLAAVASRKKGYRLALKTLIRDMASLEGI